MRAHVGKIAETRRDAVKCWEGHAPRLSNIELAGMFRGIATFAAESARFSQERCPASADHLDELSGLFFGTPVSLTSRRTKIFLVALP